MMVRVAGLDPEDEAFGPAAQALGTLGKLMPIRWRRAVVRAPIDNCDLRFELVCPKKWEERPR